jgi:putative glutathione S-transferase
VEEDCVDPLRPSSRFPLSGFAETVNIDHIKRHYYITHDDINPTRIVPLGPILDLQRPHGRERLT